MPKDQLRLHITAQDVWIPDESKQGGGYFADVPDTVIHLENSLSAVAKWESRWEKPYLGVEEEAFTSEEFFDYVRCMTVEEGIPKEVYYALSEDNLNLIQRFMARKMTATWFSDDKKRGKGKPRSKRPVTAEIIYSQMFEYGIPLECEHWHLNRLMTLLRVCKEREVIPPKMSKKDIYAQNAALNARRRARLGSKG